MPQVTVEENRPTVELSGWEQICSLKRSFSIPLEYVVNIEWLDARVAMQPDGVRLAGTYVI